MKYDVGDFVLLKPKTTRFYQNISQDVCQKRISLDNEKANNPALVLQAYILLEGETLLINEVRLLTSDGVFWVAVNEVT